MKPLARVITAIAFSFSISVGATELAAKASSTASVYTNATIEVLGAVRQIDLIMTICSESFPEIAPKNEKAYQDWKRRNSDLLSEVRKHAEIVVWRDFRGDSGAYWAGLDQIGLLLDQQKVFLIKQMKADGDARYRHRCDLYESFLLSPNGNIERRFPRQLEVMRSEPLTEADLTRPHQ